MKIYSNVELRDVGSGGSGVGIVLTLVMMAVIILLVIFVPSLVSLHIGPCQ